MSTRQVLFGSKTLQFQCGHGILLEDGRYESNRYSPRLHANAWSWCSAVNTYSSRTLTHASDRLKAVAGASKFIESLYHVDGKQPKYLVGLWQDERFHMQLRWSCREPSLSRTELMDLLQDGERYVAPSWSWASRNTGVECVADISESAIQFIKSNLRTCRKTAMVSVQFGSSVTLCGKLSQTPVEPSSGHLVPVERRWLYRWEAPNASGYTDFWLDWVPKQDDDEESRFQRQLCLLLTSVMNLAEPKAIGGLILAPVLDTETGVLFYYRVGVFNHFGDRKMLIGQPEQKLTIL